MSASKQETKVYSKKGWKKYVIWYIVAAVVVYLIIYFMFFRNGY